MAVLKCDLCAAQDNEFFAEKGGLNYLRCRNCGFVFTDVTNFDFEAFNEESIGDMKDFHVSKSTSPKHQKAYQRLLAEFAPYRQTGNFLEVGCATGSFLKSVKEAGWNAFGVEPVETSARHAIDELGLDVHVGVLDTAGYPKASFDVIYSNAVLEHVVSPAAVLAQSFELLRPGGLLYADTVNLDSYTWKFLGAKWRLFDPQMHLSLFSPATLRRFCEQAGFEVQKITTHGVRFHATRDEKPKGFARLTDELRKTPYSIAARRNLKGDNIAVYAEKRA